MSVLPAREFPRNFEVWREVIRFFSVSRAEAAMAEFSVRVGGWEDEEHLGALLSVSFTDDPYVRWLMPNALDLLNNSKKHLRRTYPAAFEARTIFVIGDFAGAAIWLPPGTKADPSEETAQAEPSADSEGPVFPPEFPELIKRSAAYCPSEPHWYLALIAVDPAHRGHGVGTQLMEHCLEKFDPDGLPMYLESINSANLSLYARFGFQKLAEVRVGSSPPRYPMLRPAPLSSG